MMPVMAYRNVGLTEEARDELRDAATRLTSPVGRRLSMSEVLRAALVLAERHRDEWTEVLRAAAPEESTGGGSGGRVHNLTG